MTHHEVLLPGHLLLKFLREQLENCLDAFRQQVVRELERAPEAVNLQDEAYVKKAAERMPDVVSIIIVAEVWGPADSACPFLMMEQCSEWIWMRTCRSCK